MTALVLPQSTEIFGSNDFAQDENQFPDDCSTSPQMDADSMDASSEPALESSEGESDEEIIRKESISDSHETIDRMIDDAFDESVASDESDDVHETTSAALNTTAKRQFGGIENLMNTCYMASALQMVGSLEAFVRKIRDSSPREDSALRRALLSVFDRLERGETVRPDELKRLIDERSCLFEGNEQQDAHEFLTTLLDLLDEDYKPKASSNSDTEDSEEKIPSTSSEDCAEDDSDMDVDEHEPPSCKRIKTKSSEEMDQDSDEDSAQESLPAGSFSELDVHQIEQLLHGSMPSSREGMILPSTHSPMNCRLVGGRMNPTETPLLMTHNPPTSVVTHERGQNNERATSSTNDHTITTQSAPTEPNLAAESKQTSASSSPVDDCFTTKVRVRLTCDSCSYTRTQEETYLHWSLEMNGDSTLDEVLRKFFASESREIKCEKCFGDSATQTSCITQLPKMLMLHFKRFVVNVSDDYSSITYDKNPSSVAFGPTLSPEEDLRDHMASECALPLGACYKLRSIVNHHGSSVNFGHYTADAHRVVLPNGTREWLRFNDSFVSSVTEQQAVQGSSKSAYLVMYELD